MRDYSLDSFYSIDIQFINVGGKTSYLVKVAMAVKKIKQVDGIVSCVSI